MPLRAPPPITLTLRHAAPVWFSRRVGAPERLALDPMSTPAEVRGVRRGEMEPRTLQAAKDSVGFPVFAFEGRLWVQVTEMDTGVSFEATMEDGLAVLSGDAWRKGPLFPVVPEAYAVDGFPGDAPMPPRALGRSSLALHTEAREEALRIARQDLVHDGRRFLRSIDLPLYHPRRERAFLNYRDPSMAWSALFPHNRPDMAVAYLRSLGFSDSLVAEAETARRSAGELQGEALRGIAAGDDHLRHLAGTAPFQVLSGLALNSHRVAAPPDDVAALKRAAALGSMGLPVADPGDLLSLLGKTSKLVASCGGIGKPARDAYHAANGIKSYCEFLLRDLAARPMPDEDADVISALSPR